MTAPADIQSEQLGEFWLDSSTGGSLVNYSSEVGGVRPPDVTNTLGGFYVINDADEQVTEGGGASKFGVDVYARNNAASLDHILSTWPKVGGGSGGARTFKINRPDSLSGSSSWTGECYLESYTPGAVSAGSSNAAKGPANFRVSNGYTRSILV